MPAIPNLEPDPQLPQYRWNRSAGRYINQKGQFVGAQEIRLQLDKVIDDITNDIANVSKSFRTGVIDGETFQMRSMALIKQAHLAGATMQKGGWFQMSQSDFGTVGQITRQEYGWFRDHVIAEILSGDQRLDGTLDARMRLYTQAGRDTYHVLETEDRAEQGFDEERRLLHGRDNCRNSKQRSGCWEESLRGWVPIGESLPIGSATCLSNCRCSKSYRNSVTGDTV